MRNKSLITGLVFLLQSGLIGLQAQTMYVRQTNGSQASYALNTITKLSFASGNLAVSKAAENSDIYALQNIRYINFKEYTNGYKPVTTSETTLFPNPVIDVLNIEFKTVANFTGLIEIFSLEGKKVYSHATSSEANIYQINVSSFPQGLYLCRINNGLSIETSKFIKQ